MVLRDTVRRNVVPAVAIGIGLSVVLSPHLGDYSLMLLAIPVAVLAPRAVMLTLAVAAAYTAASLFNPLVALNESTVALVLLAGLRGGGVARDPPRRGRSLAAPTGAFAAGVSSA